jgi:pimeloyl-ACP methyl ester carboxylesterase
VSPAETPPAERMVEIRDHRLRVSIRGEGRPVLLLNGLGASIALWDALHEDLSGLEVISFDAPGTGRSSTPAWPYRMKSLADMVAGLLDALGYDQVDVVGYSFGGVLAQQFAYDHPQRVRRLVLGATLCGWGGLAGDVLSLLSVLTPIRYYSARAYALSAPVLAGGAAEADPAFVERTAAARVADRPTLNGYCMQLMAAWSWSSLPWLHRLQAPTLVVTGAQDRLVPAVNSELIASRLPCARMLRIDGWGHYVLLDRQSGAGAAIGDFLRAERFERSDAWRRARRVSWDEASASIRAHNNVLTNMTWQHALYRWRHTRRRAA